MVPSQASEFSTHVVALCWQMLDPDNRTWSAQDLIAHLEPVLSGHALTSWIRGVDWPTHPRSQSLAEHPVDRILEPQIRRNHGIYFTPVSMANVMARVLAERLQQHHDGWVVDLSAGQGDLILPLVPKLTTVRYAMVERSAPLAVLAAARLISTRRALGQDASRDRVWIGDGLDARWPLGDRPVIAVIGNPPYVGEKHNKALFDHLKQTHTDLTPFFGGRMDLQYLFFHRALSWLAPGGVLLLLTSAYWLQATGAQQLRQDLLDRAHVDALVRFPGQSLFDDAPGHESLMMLATKSPNDYTQTTALTCDPDGVDTLALDALREARVIQLGDTKAPWRPFHHEGAAQWLELYRRFTSPLGEVVRAYQGFVSGMDRVNKQHLDRLDDVRVHDPVFLFESWDDIPRSLHGLVGTYLFPVMRGSAVSEDTIYTQPVGTCWALYIDGAIEDAAQRDVVCEHLEPFAPVLGARREVTLGRMPWYRLHWPRRRALMLGPKLVTARRGSRVCFALDLSGSVVSSDCTFVPAPKGSQSPIEDLLRLMLVLNTPLFAEGLRLTGKQKGNLMEFYAQPLKAWPVPLVFADGGVQWHPAWRDHLLAESIDALAARTQARLSEKNDVRAIMRVRTPMNVSSPDVWQHPDVLPIRNPGASP